MLLLFTACRPDPPPATDSAATDPWAGCPTLTHHLPLQGGLESYVFRLLALPGGDVVVAGTSVGAEALGLGPHNALFLGGSGGYVARLGPDGAARWAHDPGGSVQHLSLVEGGIWVAGGYHGLPEFDGVTDEGQPAGTFGTYAARLDPGTGRRQRLVALGGITEVDRGVVEDDAGNVYLASGFETAEQRLGDLVVERTDDPTGWQPEDAVLAAFDPRGRPRWLTAVGGPIYAVSAGLFRDGDTVRWIVQHRNPLGTLTATYAEEPSTHVPVPNGTTGMSVLAVDPDTGHVTDTEAFWFEEEVTPLHVENQPGGGAAVYGLWRTPNQWRDADGAAHPVPVLDSGGAVVIGPSGAVSAVRSPHTAWAWNGDVSGALLTTSGRLPQPKVFAEGTEQEVLLGRDPNDSFLVLADASDQLRCAWQVVGRGDQEVTDLAFTDDGALWVGGISRSAPYEVLDAHGDVVAAGGEDRPRGFVLRFAPTDALE